MDSNFTFGVGKFRWVINNKPNKTATGRFSGMREELEWIKRQIEYSTFAEKFKLRYNLKKGDILEIDFGLNVNSEFSSRHYGVVIKDSNEFNPQVLVCPLKTNHKGPHPRSDIDIGFIAELYSTHSTLAVINQIRPIDKLRIYTTNKIGLVDGSRLAEPDEDINEKPTPRLDNKQLELILNAYCNYVFGDFS